MNPNHLVAMANQIGAFYETMPDRRLAVADLAGHLKRFWEPRMRQALLRHADESAQPGLSAIVQEALRAHRAMLQ